MGNTNWRTEPTNVEKLADDLWLGVKGQSNREIAGNVEKLADDLWLGVKGQSNREIAGSPRKLFR